MPWDVYLPLKTAIFIFSTPPTSLQMHLSSVLPSFPPWRLNLPVVAKKALNFDSPWACLTTNSSIPSGWSQWLPPPATKAEAFDPTSHQSPRSERIRARWSGVVSLFHLGISGCFLVGGSLFTPLRYKCVSFNRSTLFWFLVWVVWWFRNSGQVVWKLWFSGVILKPLVVVSSVSSQGLDSHPSRCAKMFPP